MPVASKGRFVSPRHHLEVGVREAGRYLTKRHGGGTFSEDYLRRYFRISLRQVGVPAEELRAVVEGYRQGIRPSVAG